MGLAEIEKSFPRGGQKPAISLPKKGKFSLFGKHAEKSHTKGPSKKRKKEDTELKLHKVQPLSHKTLKEGMLVLGCVSGIEEYKLLVSLPGKLIGEISVTNISGPYTKCLLNLVQENSTAGEKVLHLNEMFWVGQPVVTQVLEIGEKVKLSMMPEAVQSEWSSRSLTVGSVIVAAVSSCEERGYIMETGIANVRAFLKSSAAEEYISKWNKGKQLGVGQVVKCVVTKSDATSFVATVQLSIDPLKLSKPMLSKEEFTMDTVLPGTVFKVYVSRVMKNGLEVNCGGHFKGYIHQDHLSDVWDKLENCSAGDTYTGILLYIMPTVKFFILSLKKNLYSPEPVDLSLDEVKIGDVRKAKVFDVDVHGVTLKLSKTIKGFVPPHHLPNYNPNHEINKDDMYKDLPVGSKHECRVLGYNYMLQLFICTLNKKLIEAEYLRASDLKPGMKVSCVIREHKQKGAIVDIKAGGGKITGFVRSVHMGNVPLANPEKKFPVGSTHPTKVLHVEGHKLSLTMKSKLVESEAPPLCHLEDFHKGMKCEGVVVLIKENGLLLTFYGDAKGWLTLNKADTEETFYLGQLLKCYVIRVDVEMNKLLLSLKDPFVGEQNKLEIGHPYKLKVKQCKDDGLAVKVVGQHDRGMVPEQHLTDNPTLAHLLLKTYSAGDIIEHAYCFNNKGSLFFTLRPTLVKYFQNGKLFNWSKVNVNRLLPCAVEKMSTNRIKLRLPVLDSHAAHIECKNLTDIGVEDTASLGLQVHQGLMSRVVMSGNSKKERKTLTTKLSKCWDNTPEPGVNLLLSFWKDYDKITCHMIKEANPLAKLKPGDRVKCKVTEVYEDGLVLKMKSGVKGVVTPQLIGTKVECGDVVEGTVIYLDYQNNCCELTTNNNIMERINTVQDGKLAGGLGVDVGVRGEVLSIRPEMIIIVLKSIGRQQLAYIPTRCHINDLVPDLKNFKIGETSKMVVQAIVDGRIICIQQRFEFQLIKMRAKHAVNQKNKKNIVGDSKNAKKSLENEKFDEPSKSDVEVEQESSEAYNSDQESSEADVEFNQESSEADNSVLESSRANSVEESDRNNIKLGKKSAKPLSVNFFERQNEESSDEEESEFLKKCEEKALENFNKRPISECEDREHVGKETKHKKRKLSDSTADESRPLARLSLQGGFVWDANPNLLLEGNTEVKSDSSSDDEDAVEKEDGRKKRKRLTKAEMREKAIQEEERLRATEQMLLNFEKGPQSVDDFDRLVLSSPDSSLCWIKYMAFHLQATEIEKARAVAQRALSTISFREEQEKLNVWCALLNLENLYGSKESVKNTLNEALKMNEPFKVYIKMLHIYADSKKIEETEQLVSTVTKKFRENKEAWIQSGEALLKVGKLEKSRLLMQKALNGLEKKYHVEVISKFAHLENRLGEPERAQTLMEHILTSYPKRTDVWITYVDMLVKKGLQDAARQVLERAVAQKLPIRKMKSLFSKFVQFEEQHGTPETVAKIHQMVKDYVETTGGTKDEEL